MVPSGQAVGAELPAAQKEETGHCSHVSSPSLFWKVPASHRGQDGTPRASLAVPIEQFRQEPELLAPVIG